MSSQFAPNKISSLETYSEKGLAKEHGSWSSVHVCPVFSPVPTGRFVTVLASCLCYRCSD